jgi:hypothetical protein
MSHHHVDIDAVDPTPDRPSVERSIGDAAGLDRVDDIHASDG